MLAHFVRSGRVSKNANIRTAQIPVPPVIDWLEYLHLNRIDAENAEYEVLDLYKMKYDPILSWDELYTAGNRHISRENLEIQEKIKSTDKLIFIYPVWWNSMPAILKGFFDRVLTPSFAYKFSSRGIPQKLLKGKKAAVFITSASSGAVSFIFLRNRAKQLIREDLLGFCGIDSRVYQFGSATKLTESNRQKIKKMVEKRMDYLY